MTSSKTEQPFHISNIPQHKHFNLYTDPAMSGFFVVVFLYLFSFLLLSFSFWGGGEVNTFVLSTPLFFCSMSYMIMSYLDCIFLLNFFDNHFLQLLSHISRIMFLKWLK